MLGVVTWLPIIGAAIAIGGGFLPWVSGGADTSAWDISIIGMFTHDADDFANNDVSAGLVLLLAAGVAIPLLIRRPLPRILALAFAGVATNVAVLGFFLYFDLLEGPGVSMGIGMFVTLVGGIAMAVGALMAPRHAR